MRSTDEIYQDLKNKYENLLLDSKKRTKYKLTKEQIIAISILIASTTLLMIALGSVFLLGAIYNDNSLISDLSYLTKHLLRFFGAIIFLEFLLFVSLRYYFRRKNKNPTPLSSQYKKTVINDLVKEVCPSLEYDLDILGNESIYKNAGFNNYNTFHSEGVISGSIGNIEDFELSDIYTESELSDGERVYNTIINFEGLFSKATSPIYSSFVIDICSQNILGANSILGNKVTLDSGEFEKYFDVFSNNKLFCMKVLTSDILDIILSFRKETNIPIDLIFKESSIFIRYHIKNVFETHINEPINKEEIEKTLFTLSSIIKLNTDLNEALKKKDLNKFEM